MQAHLSLTRLAAIRRLPFCWTFPRTLAQARLVHGLDATAFPSADVEIGIVEDLFFLCLSASLHLCHALVPHAPQMLECGRERVFCAPRWDLRGVAESRLFDNRGNPEDERRDEAQGGSLVREHGGTKHSIDVQYAWASRSAFHVVQIGHGGEAPRAVRQGHLLRLA